MPPWYNTLKMAEKWRGGYGVNMDEWRWCVRGELAAIAEGMAQDDNAFNQLDRERVVHPKVSESKKAARAALRDRKKRTA